MTVNDRCARIDDVLHSYADEKPSLYSVLDKKAREWWHHKRLRKWGETQAAREAERRSIRDTVGWLKKALENGGYATISMTGGKYTITMGDNSNVSGYDESLIIAAYLVGLPVLDWRGATDAGEIMRMPMPVIGNCKYKRAKLAEDKLKPGYPGAFSYISLQEYFYRAKQIGAVIYWRPTLRSKMGHY